MAIQNATPIFGDFATDASVGTGPDHVYNIVVDFTANPINTGGDQLRILSVPPGGLFDVLGVEVTSALSTTFQLGDEDDADEIVTTANGTAAVGAKTITKRTMTNGSPLSDTNDLLITADSVAMTTGRIVIKARILGTGSNIDLAVEKEYTN